MQVAGREYSYLHPICVTFKYFSKQEKRKSSESGSVKNIYLLSYLLPFSLTLKVNYMVKNNANKNNIIQTTYTAMNVDCKVKSNTLQIVSDIQ